MRFPITQAASMATYIAKNKLRPRPEWQKNLGSTEDLKNPFRIIWPVRKFCAEHSILGSPDLRKGTLLGADNFTSSQLCA